MKVEIDGKIEERCVSHIERSDSFFSDNSRGLCSLPREVPCITDSERVVWRLGSLIPLIIKVTPR